MMWPWRSVSIRPSIFASSGSDRSSDQRRKLKAVCSRWVGNSIVSVAIELILNAHAEQEFDIAASFLKLVEDQLHGFDWRHAGERAAQNDDFIVFVGMVEQFLFACAGTFDVNRRENAAVHERAIEVHFHVTGAFELFKNDFIHSGAGIHQRGCNNRK